MPTKLFSLVIGGCPLHQLTRFLIRPIVRINLAGGLSLLGHEWKDQSYEVSTGKGRDRSSVAA
jgi:hypothetical protein